MSGPRRVRFALGSPSGTPSPSYSIASLPASDEPSTPPTASTLLPGGYPGQYSPSSPPGRGFSIYAPAGPTLSSSPSNAYIPEYPQFVTQDPTGPHPLLSRETCGLKYDLAGPLTTISLADAYAWNSRIWEEPASKPAMQVLQIAHERLPWTITVSCATPGGSLSVRDVLQGLYESLRKSVTHDEYESLPAQQRDEARQAFKERCYRDNATFNKEWESGLRRVDVLGRSTLFAGFAPSSRGANVWKLVVGRPPMAS